MKLISTLLSLICSISISAQILTFDFDGLTGSEATANSNSNDPNISSSTISRGAGLTASGNNDRFNANGWSTVSIANAISGNDYMEFTITPNSGCNFSITSIVIQLARSGTGPSAIILRSSLDGFSTNLDTQYSIADNTSSQTFTFTFTQSTISTATTYRIYMYAEATTGTGGPGDGPGNDIIVNGSTNCAPPPSNTITINSLSSLNYSVDCTTGSNGSVNISSTDAFTAGNIYTVELSDASGSFASPTAIGSMTSTSNGPIDINYTIPAGTLSGSGYRIRIVSSNPVVTSSDNGNNITITLTESCILEPPHMTSVYINSCNPTCDEGFNELVFGSSGDYSFDVNTTDFNFEYGSNASPSSNTSYADVLVNNTTRINELNAAAGCPGLFIDAVGTTIPPNSSWMLAHTGICEEALDWTGLCGSGPIYVIFQNDSDWNTNGNFVNSNSGMRYLNTRIITTSADVFDIDYNFNSNTYANSDGVFVQYNSSGGAPTLYGDDDCNLTPVVLPVELYSFNGKIENNETYLYWTTLSEYNFSHFQIYHATENSTFKEIGKVNTTGNSISKQDYRMIHPEPAPGVNYYQLKAIDNDGKINNHGIIALQNDIHFLYYNPVENLIVLDSDRKSVV